MERFSKVKEIFCLNIDELLGFDFPTDELFGLKVLEDDICYEFLVKFASENHKLISFGSSIVGNRGLKPPVFMRYSWIDYFRESVIFYNDPTYYVSEDITGGWHIGTNDIWYLEVISKIIVKLMENRSIFPENTLFYGTSSGGHASVQLATLIKNSTALISNFQSFMIHSRTKHSFEKIRKYCFDGMDEKDILDEYACRFEVLELFKKENYVPPIIYMVNLLSEVDIMEQCLPFIKGLTEVYSHNDVEIILHWDPKGHSSRVDFKDAYPFIKSVLYRDKDNYKYYENDIKCFKKFITARNTKKILKLKKENEYLKNTIENYQKNPLSKIISKLNRFLTNLKRKSQ